MNDRREPPHPNPLAPGERGSLGRLAENILYFARALRAAGIPVGPGAVLDALEAVKAAGVGTRDDFYWTLHAVFVKRHEHSVLFDQAFRLFFRRRGYVDQLLAMMLPQAPPSAPQPPIVVITSNRTREIHDAIKRRCLYHWVGYPSVERELTIVRTKVPRIGKALSIELVHFVQSLRKQDLFKPPGVAETLDWTSALAELDVVALDPATVTDTLGVLLKYQDDIARIEGTKAKELLQELRAEMRAAE